MSEAIASVTFEDFVEAERRATSDRRREFVNGRIYVMTGATERHDLVAGRLYNLLSPGAYAKGCRPFASNRLLHTRTGNAYCPDVMVACGRAPHELYETDPALVVEVLSPSTRGIDRREKSTAYAMAPTLGLLLLVDPDDRRIEAARPVDGRVERWDVFGPGDVVITEFGDIEVDALYDAVDAAATT